MDVQVTQANDRDVRFAIWHANDHVIIMAAQQGDLGSDWAAYMSVFDTGTGAEHMRRETLSHGDKMPQPWAEAVFPGFAERYRWRA